MKAPFLMGLGAFFLGLAVLYAGKMDYEDQLDQQAEACQMHEVWFIERREGIPEWRRMGWPVSEIEYARKCGGEFFQ